jgi:serine/threonine protein kinase
MAFREPAPDGSRGPDNLPLLVLTDGTVLKGLYTVKYLTAGGMSIIYTALRDGEKYLLKEVEAADSKKVLSLTQEKFTLERLNNPGIVKVYDLFEQDGFYYMVLEHIEGQSMEKLISPLVDVFIQEKVILNWALQICDIFEYLHRQNPPIVYRDLKPRNLVKDKSGRLHLVDFGIARVFKQGRSRDTEAMGSALTASPEHYGGAQTDARSDIFTIGATLHFLITNGRGQGDEPFEFAPVRSINPKISDNMEQVIKKCLLVDPRKRYQSIREMRQALLNSREVPLPVLEPLGDAGESESPLPVSTSAIKKEAVPENAHPPIALLPTIAVAALCIVVILIGALAVRTAMKRTDNTVYITPAASVAVTPSITSGIHSSPEVPATTVAVSATPTPSSPASIPAASVAIQPTSNLPPPTIAESPVKPVTDKPPVPTQRPPSLPGSGTVGTEPPDDTSPAWNNGRNGGRGRFAGNPGTGDLAALPTITPGTSDDQKERARIYQDNRNGFQLLLPTGWVVDSTILRRESSFNSNVVGAFSHVSPPSLGGPPLAAFVVRMERARKGVADPQTYLDEWLLSDEQNNRIARRLSTSSKETVGGRERATSDVMVHLMGNETLQTRMVYVDSSNDRVAYIKCYFRGKRIDRAEKLKEFEGPVLNSFGFVGN